MATIIYPTAASVYTRVIDTTGLSEFHVDVQPNLVFVLTGSFPNTSSVMFIQGYDTGSIYPISSSWSLNVVSASSTNSASYTLTASYALNSSTTTQLNSTNPTYKLYATASIPFSSGSISDVLCFVTFTSSHARGDGGDIRIQANDGLGNPSGPYIPLSVNVGFLTGSSVTYIVNWSDNFISGTIKNYVMTYGDPLGNYMYLNQSQLLMLRKRSNVTASTVVYNDNNQADWFPDTSWGTLGTRIPTLTNDDDTWASIAPVGGFWYGGQFRTNFAISPNCFFSPINATPGSYNLTAPDEWACNNFDNYNLWCDLCYSSDGWFLQYYNRRGFSGAPFMKAVLRYRNTGKFILSVFDTNPAYQALLGTMTLQGYTSNTYWGYTFIDPTGSNQQTALAIVIEPCATAGISGNELPYP